MKRRYLRDLACIFWYELTGEVHLMILGWQLRRWLRSGRRLSDFPW